MRIFIGLTEIANIVNTYSDAFRQMGHEPVTIVQSANRYYPDSTYNYVLSYKDRARRNIVEKMARVVRAGASAARLFPGMLDSCDVFIFMWGTSFLPFFLDYSIIKKAGKKIISTFWGSEIRYAPALKHDLIRMGVAADFEPFIEYLHSTPSNLGGKREIVAAAEKYADLILSQAGYGQLQKRPYMRATVPIDLSQCRFNVPGRKVPKVVHVPNNRDIKGTSFVLKAIEQLKGENLPFEFQLIENTPNNLVKEILADADIVIDQLFSDTVASLSTEAMASGCVAMAHYLSEYAKIPAGCPTVDVTKDTLTARLREIILDRDLRCRLAEAGRPYVEANNDHIKVAGQLLEWLKPDALRTFDFYPGVTAQTLEEENVS